MNRKKLLIVVLMISFLVSSLVIISSDDSEASPGNVFYSSDNCFKYTVQTEDVSTSTGTVSVSRFSVLSGSITIPSTVIKNSITYNIVAIDANGFKNSTGITSLTIGSNITSIGNSAFYGCNKIVSLTLPSSVQSIGDYAFYNCSKITSIIIPAGVQSIGNFAFGNCTGATTISMPDSLTSIGNNAFYYCYNLISVTIPSGVQFIGDNAFYNCTGLASITLPSNINSIGNYVFYNCTGLTTVNIPSGVTSIGNYAFYNCTGLTTVNIPSSVNSIGDYAFYNCNKLTSFTFPSNVTYIGNSAFASCRGLTSVDIPSGSIGPSAFQSCTGLLHLTIGSNVTYIGNSAFNNCSSLIDAIIGDGVVSIGDNAFHSCKKLETVVIPLSISSIGDTAFYNCTALRSVSTPSSTTSIGENVFGYCSSFSSVLYNADSTMLIYCPPSKHGDFEIPSTVNTIASGAFYYGTLTSISVPASVTSIGSCAFYKCSGLTSIMLYGQPSDIGEYAFYVNTNNKCNIWSTGWANSTIFNSTITGGNILLFSPLYTVTFDSNGGSSVPDQMIPENTYATFPSSTLTGHTLSGWFTDPSSSTAYDFNDPITSDLTLYAVWTTNTYAVSIPSDQSGIYVVSGGTTATYGSSYSFTITVNAAYSQTSPVVTVGSGTFASSHSGNVYTYTVSSVTGNLSFTESQTWNKNTYTVTFDSGAGTSATPSTIRVTYDGTYGTLATTSRTGCTFAGWYTSTGEKITETTSVTITADQTLYASWTTNTYTVTIDEGTGTTISISNINAQYGSDYSFTVNSNTGYDHGTPSVSVLIGGTAYLNLTNIGNIYTIQGTDIVNEITILTSDLSPNLYTVSGTLMMGNVSSPAGITVNLMSGSNIYTAVTDYEGKYVLRNVPYGTSGKIVVSLDHYHQNALLSISVNRDLSDENVSLYADSYVVTWENYDGAPLETDYVTYESIPFYNGPTPQKDFTTSYFYEFSGWSPTISAVTGNITYTAIFDSVLRNYIVSISSSTYGLFSGAGTYQVGDTVTINFTTGSQHYIVEQWDVYGVEVISQTSTSLTFTMPANDTTVSYTIIKDPSIKEYEISYINSSSVSITPDPNTLDEGTIESFTVESNTGCTSLTIIVRDSTNAIIYQGTFTDTDADGVITGTFTLTMTDNVTIELLSTTPTNNDIDMNNDYLRAILIIFLILLILVGYIVYRKYIRPRLIEKRDEQDNDRSS